MITFHLETVRGFLSDAKHLLPLHWKELALDQDTIPLDPQYEVYIERESRGECFVMVAREAGAIVGYFVGFVAPGLHYKTCLTLTGDIFWIHPESRGGRLGFKLFDEVEKEARRRGVQRMFVGSKMHKDVSVLFQRLGYTEVERYWSKTWSPPQ